MLPTVNSILSLGHSRWHPFQHLIALGIPEVSKDVQLDFKTHRSRMTEVSLSAFLAVSLLRPLSRSRMLDLRWSAITVTRSHGQLTPMSRMSLLRFARTGHCEVCPYWSRMVGAGAALLTSSPAHGAQATEGISWWQVAAAGLG